MAKSRSTSRRIIATLVLIWVAIATVVFAPTASAAKDYGSLTATWWQWALAQPAIDVAATNTNTNPVLDTTGEYATAGQPAGIGPANKYFFLAGTFGQDVVRTVTVPPGKTLFFPIFNFEADNAVDPITHFKVPELKALAKANVDGAINLTATFDGAPVAFFRSTSPVFDYTMPDENSIYEYFGFTGPQFTGRIKPAVADGYWAILPPPTPGEHVLRFTAASSLIDFSLDVTYQLTTS
ncbi:MAG TPA: hypothetical protein VIU11_16945 [Nakamurella sp.]